MDRATLIRLLGLCASVSLCEKKSAAQSAAQTAAESAAAGSLPACAKCPFKEKVKACEALARKPPGGH